MKRMICNFLSTAAFFAMLLSALVPLEMPAQASESDTTVAQSVNYASLPADWKQCMIAGGTYKQNGKYNEAEPYLRKALALAESQFGSSDKKYMLSLNLLAGNCRFQGKLAEAEQLYKQTVEVARKNNFSDEQVATILDNLAQVQNFAGKLSDAVATEEEALALYKKSVGEHNVDYAMTLGNYGHLVSHMGKLSDGEKLMVQAIETLQSLPQSSPIAIADACDNLAGVYCTDHKFSEAEKYQALALSIYEKALPSGIQDWSLCLRNLATTQIAQGHYAEAMKLYEKALPAVEKTQGVSSLEAIEIRRLQAEAGKHIPGWKPAAPQPGSELAQSRDEQVLKAVAKIDGAFPNVNPAQISELSGRTLDKGRIPGFWFSQRSSDALFEIVTAQVPPGRDIPNLVVMKIPGDIKLTKQQVIAQFGQPTAVKEVSTSDGIAEALSYTRSWGTLSLSVNKTNNRTDSILFLYN